MKHCVFVFAGSLWMGLLSAATPGMPAAQQNDIVQRHCAVCHDDAHRNGGLTLQHYDAAVAEPGLAAMLLSKLRNGAIFAAGIAPPDDATQASLVNAFTAQGQGAENWFVNSRVDAATKAPVMTASIVRELPGARENGEPALYRLVLACNGANHQGEMQLTWSPMPAPKTGRDMSATVDGKTTFTYRAEGSESMGNGASITTGTAAIELRKNNKTPLPVQSLTVTDLFPKESVEFNFGSLPAPARQALSPCFGAR